MNQEDYLDMLLKQMDGTDTQRPKATESAARNENEKKPGDQTSQQSRPDDEKAEENKQENKKSAADITSVQSDRSKRPGRRTSRISSEPENLDDALAMVKNARAELTSDQKERSSKKTEKNKEKNKEPKKEKKGDKSNEKSGEKTKEKFTARDLIETIIYVAIVVAITFCIITFVGQRTIVDGSSMEPTLSDGDNLIVDKISYRFHDPERFDIIIFPYKFDDSENYIKRIIGLPGETVWIDSSGTIYINGEKLPEDYGLETIQNAGLAASPITLGDDEYFVLGDNRNNSEDSRFPDVGLIKRSDIIGRAWVRFFPLSDAHTLGPSYHAKEELAASAE